MTQKQSPAKETISLQKFAKYVAGKVLKFMEVNLVSFPDVLGFEETDMKVIPLGC
jgi:hypothetical protein